MQWEFFLFIIHYWYIHCSSPALRPLHTQCILYLQQSFQVPWGRDTLYDIQLETLENVIRQTFDKHIWNVLSAWTWPGEWLSAGKKIIATFAFDKEFKIALKMNRTIPHFFELWKLSIRRFWLVVVSCPNRLSLYRSSSIFQQPKKK